MSSSLRPPEGSPKWMIDEWEAGFGNSGGVVQEVSRAKSRPEIWFVRWGQSVSRFFSPLTTRAASLWDAVSRAGQSLARFFIGKGSLEDIDRATRHIKSQPDTTDRKNESSSVSSVGRTTYFETSEEVIEQERNMGSLGGIPKDLPAPVATSTSPLVIQPSPAEEKFNAYLQAREENRDISAFINDEALLKYAQEKSRPAKEKLRLKLPLTDEEKAIRAAANDLRDESDKQKLAAKTIEQREAAKAERSQKTRERADKKPGQLAFEKVVAAFKEHKQSDQPFRIYAGSMYLADECLAYGKAQTDLGPEGREALAYLEQWRKDPMAAARRLDDATGFIDARGLQTPVPVAIGIPSDGPEPSGASPTEISAPPPPMPRWISTIQALPAWSSRQSESVAGVFSMHPVQITKALQGLRFIAGMTASSKASVLPPDSSKSTTVERRLNYDAESERQSRDLLESLELAQLLIQKLQQDPGLRFDVDLQPFFATIRANISGINETLQKKIGELLPAKPQPAVEKIRIPSLAELSDEQAKLGNELFENYVQAYARLRGNQNYFLPERSRYFNPACLSFATALVDDKSPSPKGEVFDEIRQQASIFLLSEARRYGLVQ